MRTFFILMVLANLGYFGWRYHNGELRALDAALNPPAFSPAVPAPPPDPEPAKSLVLVSELPESARLAAEISAGTPVVTARSGEDGAPATAAPPPSTPEPAAPPPTRSQPVTPMPRQCAKVDGLDQEAAATELAELLTAAGIENRMEPRQTQTGSTWWVYLPAFATDALTQRMLAELKEKGIDSYYMRTGELAGGISLGVYSREASAKAAQQSLSQRGYSANIQQVFRMGTLYEVVAQASVAALNEARGMAGFLAAHGNAQVAEFVCGSVAEANQLP
ncbi:MAG TPA: SPOR domain-containing protein [Hyphomicrobiales bacterium]|nr:SPOR domain-containing protein [Hyphomicrobiales bacterium]